MYQMLSDGKQAKIQGIQKKKAKGKWNNPRPTKRTERWSTTNIVLFK
jgi:hypothetical protein